MNQLAAQATAPTTPPALALVVAADSYGAVPPIAYRLGVLDARLDGLCLPELYFRNPQQKLQYTMGHESVKGRTLLSDDMMGRKQ